MRHSYYSGGPHTAEQQNKAMLLLKHKSRVVGKMMTLQHWIGNAMWELVMAVAGVFSITTGNLNS